MRSIEEVLAEIDRRIQKEERGAKHLGFSGQTLFSDLRDLKQFILSDECEHEWAGTELNYCKKCGVGI